MRTPSSIPGRDPSRGTGTDVVEVKAFIQVGLSSNSTPQSSRGSAIS
jgi:hypothetical protein